MTAFAVAPDADVLESTLVKMGSEIGTGDIVFLAGKLEQSQTFYIGFIAINVQMKWSLIFTN